MAFNPIQKALEKPTKKNLIAAMCAHCVGCCVEGIESGFRDAIRQCDSKVCPLVKHRPYKPKSDPLEKTMIISSGERKK